MRGSLSMTDPSNHGDHYDGTPQTTPLLQELWKTLSFSMIRLYRIPLYASPAMF